MLALRAAAEDRLSQGSCCAGCCRLNSVKQTEAPVPRAWESFWSMFSCGAWGDTYVPSPRGVMSWQVSPWLGGSASLSRGARGRASPSPIPLREVSLSYFVSALLLYYLIDTFKVLITFKVVVNELSCTARWASTSSVDRLPAHLSSRPPSHVSSGSYLKWKCNKMLVVNRVLLLTRDSD